MKSGLGKLDVGSLKEIAWNLFLLSAGSVICVVGINGILIPQEFLSGGFTGLAIGLHYLTPRLPVSWLYFLLNVPLYLLGWRYVGRRFFLYSIAGTIIFSAAIELVPVTLQVENKILAALLAGIIVGVGSGIILRSRGSAGGLDILSVILLQRFSYRLGTTGLVFNSVLLVAGAYIFSFDQALYTLIYIYVTARMVNLVVTGLSQRKAVMVISPRWKEIAETIVAEIHRGVTLLEGEGAYTHQKTKVLYTVIAFRELPRVKAIIRREDPNAFAVVSETMEVIGYRIGNQPRW